MIPARHTIVVDRAFFSDEFSHIPLRALRGVRAEDPNQVVVLKHLWTTHASSWDYDTDIKFVLYGPGFVKEGVRLEKTTLQNIAPTYARLIGANAPKGSMGRVMTEALVPTTKKPKVILTIVMDGGGRSLYDGLARRLARHQGPRRAGCRVHGREGHAARNRDGRLPRRDRNRRLSAHDAHRGERDLRSGEEAGHPVIPRLLARVHHGAHARRRVWRQRRSQAGGHWHELPGPSGDGHGRPWRCTSPRQQEPHRRALRPAEEARLEGAVPGRRSGAPPDDEYRPLYLPGVPPRSEPDALRQGADRRQRHMDGAQGRRQLQRPLHARLRRVRVRQHADDDGPRAHRPRPT